MILFLLFLSWSLLALRLGVKSFKSPDAPPCFVAHRRGGHHARRRRPTVPSSTGAADDLDSETREPGILAAADASLRRVRTMQKNGRMPFKSGGNGGAAHPQDGDAARAAARMREARLVEKLLLDAVGKTERSRRSRGAAPQAKLFPSIRKCNAALATFGDAGEFRRALSLFTKMRKSVSLFGLSSSRRRRIRLPPLSSSSSSSSSTPILSSDREGGEGRNNHSHRLHSVDLVREPPKPTLVTYSTLMSRAVSLGKPRVALRLWNLMRNQPNFYLNVISTKRRRRKRTKPMRLFITPAELEALEREEGAIVPDVISCNTLMNAYAKLGDHASARSVLDAMLGDDGGERVVSAERHRRSHEGIPSTLRPTVVSYNTLADACKAAGELGAALEVLEMMTDRAAAARDPGLWPDAQTYTILIATVARKGTRAGGARDVRSGGERDPDMAFALLNRMMSEGIVPNGVTYCALIDACSRCRRVDLALNGLRIMLKQKSKASLAASKSQRRVPIYHQQALPNEVGAWTAAINACGKMGRVDTAIRLFRTMQKVGVKPNAVTCGCLSDCLLKATPIRMAETVEVLQYMEQENLVPGEVMYTSLMGIALSLAERENGSVIRKGGLQVNLVDKFDGRRHPVPTEAEDAASEAIFLYTELMRCLVHDENDDMILRVFLLFQEMRNAGATPDVACYNLLLRACALDGDVQRAQDVLWRMDADGIEPNRASWREALKAAAKAMRSDIADAIWNAAVSHGKKKKDTKSFVPKVSDVELLLNVYLQELRNTSDHEVRNSLNRKILRLYTGILSRSEEKGLHHESLNLDEIEGNQQIMLSVLRAAVSYELHAVAEDERSRARDLAVEIAALETFQRKLSPRTDRASKKALQVAQDWLYSYNY